METLQFLLTSTFYPPYHLGGDAVHVKYLAEELVKRGHEVHVLHSLDAYNVKRKRLPERIERDGVYTHGIKTHLNRSSYMAYVLGSSSSITKEFEELVKEIKPDVVHHHNISLLGYGLLKSRGDYLNFYTAHDYWLICQQSNLLKNGSETCEGNACFFCVLRNRRLPQIWRRRDDFNRTKEDIDVLIAPSDYVRNKISESLNAKAVTIPNFVPEPPNPVGPSGFSDFFLYAGVLEKHKGILNLINVCRETMDEIDANLIIVGEGSQKEQINGFVERNKLRNRIAIQGWVDRNLLYRLLKDANALIMPSIWPETSSLIALEAMSVGTPAIVPNIGALPEIVGKVDEGLIYESTEELRRILVNFTKSKRLSHIKDIYERHYSPLAYFRKYSELINTLEGQNWT